MVAMASSSTGRGRLTVVVVSAIFLLFTLYMLIYSDAFTTVSSRVKDFSYEHLNLPLTSEEEIKRPDHDDGRGNKVPDPQDDVDAPSTKTSAGAKSTQDTKPTGKPESSTHTNSSAEAEPSMGVDAALDAGMSEGDTPAKAQVRPAQCYDPYHEPGYLHIDRFDKDYNRTKWIPFDDLFLDDPPPKNAKYPYDAKKNGEVWFSEDSKTPDKFLNSPGAPTPWMNMAIEEARAVTHKNKTLDKLKWVNGRVMVFVSDSIDRFNVHWVCREFVKRKADPKAKVVTSVKRHGHIRCHIPSLNLTLLHWHLAGMTNYHPAWWWDEENITDVPFEERWNHTWSETFPYLTSIDGKGPTFVMWQSAVWDRRNLWGVAGEHYGKEQPSYMRNLERPLVWEEVTYYAARAKVLLQMLRDRLGKDTPFMLRTSTMDRKDPGTDMQTYQMDRIARAVGKRFGVEVFNWGRIMAGHTNLYKDHMHLGQGPASWLWATMAFEYLARAVGAGTEGGAQASRAPYFDSWEACHKWLV